MEQQAKLLLWIIDSQHWPRALFRAELIERGFEATGYLDIAHALWAFRQPYLEKPDMIILELCGLDLKRNELEDLIMIGVPVILLGGAVELNEKLVREFKWAAVMQRPFTIGNVADIAEQLLKGRDASSLR
ncbi:MAG: hypothetical protein ACUBOA_06045 [Candidatus Loosdrechtia sp.]|uniref:hypothetical protein n=1 Tax=Candidatus Loosdrechtia sp. TaxID=3101272 RepID=UPI003A653AF4|nr:MAG: hypothetical protein QY305_09225 [Candidatus Jettenia sp. AMX2]